MPGGQVGDTRIGLASANQLDGLKAVLLLAFQREASRIGGDAVE